MADRAENVLLIILDTVRAGDCYPERSGLTPTIRDTSTSGTLFTRAISPYPWSLASHASMYTGKYATEHGATSENRMLSPEVPVLAEQLRAEGITNGVFTGNFYLSESFGMQRGFDEWDFMKGRSAKYFSDGFNPLGFVTRTDQFDSPVAKYRAVAKEIAKGPLLKNIVNAAYFKFFFDSAGDPDETQERYDVEAIASATEFIQERVSNDERFFTVVNLLGAHAPWPYDPERLRAIGIEPESIASEERWERVAGRSADQWPYIAGDVQFDETEQKMLHHLYESWVHEVDSLAGELLQTLDEAGIRDETLCIVTSDHGEMICENGVLGHNVSLAESVARVPLVVDGPSIENTVIDDPVSLKDIYGTVLSRTGVDTGQPTLADADGSALSETYGADPGRIARVDEDYVDRERVSQFFQKRRALYTRKRVVEKRYGDGTVHGDETLLPDLEAVVERLSPAGASDREAGVDAEVQQRLRDLGYAE